jgi:AmmeMemoRadiSam system protein A
MRPLFDPLSEEDRRALLSLARQAIVETVCRQRFPDLPPVSGRLAQPGGAFVTLRSDGRVRGCIGRTDAPQDLAETVLQCAITAASQDTRFKPLCPEEVARLEIEISVISEPRPVRPEEIELGTHGIIAVRGGSRGLLLPQVATERNWSTTQFLEAACRKAKLTPDAWRDRDTNLLAFTAEVFSDAGVLVLSERSLPS